MGPRATAPIIRTPRLPGADDRWSEDDLLIGLTDALTLGGWRWQHVRRSDRAIVQGHAGWPDIVAVRDGVLLVLECKTARGIATAEQLAWLRELRDADVDARLVRPADYDALVLELLAPRPPRDL